MDGELRVCMIMHFQRIRSPRVAAVASYVISFFRRKPDTHKVNVNTGISLHGPCIIICLTVAYVAPRYDKLFGICCSRFI